MDDHLVRQITLGHLHFSLPQPVGAAPEQELVGHQGEDLSIFVLIASRASTQAYLD